MKPSERHACLVLCTCPDQQAAKRLSTGLVGEKLAACVNIVANIRSVFRWQGEIQEAEECLLIIKTTESKYAALETWLRASHPYDLPEILVVPVAGGLEGYLTWINEETA